MSNWLAALFSTAAAVVTLASGTVAVFVLYRSKNSEVLRSELEAWKGKAERLSKDHEEFTAALHERDLVIKELQGRTDLNEVKANQAAISQMIAKQSAAILENQTQGMMLVRDMHSALLENTIVLEKVQKRLDQGLIMK